jgi:hypothetical protein
VDVERERDIKSYLGARMSKGERRKPDLTCMDECLIALYIQNTRLIQAPIFLVSGMVDKL